MNNNSLEKNLYLLLFTIIPLISPALLDPVPAAEMETQFGAGNARSSSASKVGRFAAEADFGLLATGAAGAGAAGVFVGFVVAGATERWQKIMKMS